jgi:pyruvate dehydrogenase (quinone)
VPVLAIAAHIPAAKSGSINSTSEKSIQGLCHYVELVSNPKLLPQILKRAIRGVIAERGVAVVALRRRVDEN